MNKSYASLVALSITGLGDTSNNTDNKTTKGDNGGSGQTTPPITIPENPVIKIPAADYKAIKGLAAAEVAMITCGNDREGTYDPTDCSKTRLTKALRDYRGTDAEDYQTIKDRMTALKNILPTLSATATGDSYELSVLSDSGITFVAASDANSNQTYTCSLASSDVSAGACKITGNELSGTFVIDGNYEPDSSPTLSQPTTTSPTTTPKPVGTVKQQAQSKNRAKAKALAPLVVAAIKKCQSANLSDENKYVACLESGTSDELNNYESGLDGVDYFLTPLGSPGNYHRVTINFYLDPRSDSGDFGTYPVTLPLR